MAKRIRLVSFVTLLLLALLLVGTASAAGPERLWVAAYTHDVTAGWSEGDHFYSYDWTWTEPAPGGSGSVDYSFTVSTAAPLYQGTALIRLGFVMVRAPDGPGCLRVNTIHPDQPTQFLVGWVTDVPMTRPDAMAHFDSLTGTVTWDGTRSATLEGHAIIPYDAQIWEKYACTWTMR